MGNEKKVLGRPLWIALGAAVVFLLVFSIYMQQHTLRAAQQKLAAETTALENTKTRLQQMEQVKARGEDMQQQLAFYSRQVPATPLEEELIGDVQNFAAMSGMRLQQVLFEERVSKEEYTEMPFRAELSGDYYGFIQFLTGLQNNERALRVGEFKLSKDGAGLIRADLYISAFYIT